MALIASFLTIFCVGFGFRKAAAIPASLLASIFLVLGLLGANAWNASRINNGAGLPALFPADPSYSGPGAAVFFAASTGAALVGLLAALASKTGWSADSLRTILENKSIQRGAIASIILMFVLWCAGQGPSVLARVTYLSTDGSEVLLKSFSLLAPLVSIAALAILAASKERSFRIGAVLLGLIWWATSASVGTRISVGFAVVVLFILVSACFRSRNAAGIAIGLAVLYLAAWALLLTFAITLVVRSQPHGLLRLPELLTDPGIPLLFDLKSWVVPAQWLTSSVSAAFPITEQSVIHAPAGSVILSNLNPLPANVLDIDPYTFERLWPYYWVPMSFLGELSGAFGNLAAGAAVAVVAAAAGFWAALLQRRKHVVGVLVTFVLVLVFAFVSIQYSSRIAGRVASFIIIAPALFAVVPAVLRVIAPRTTLSSTGGNSRRRPERPRPLSQRVGDEL